MDEPKIDDARSEKSETMSAPSVSVFSLIQLFENLVLIGLTSLEKWDNALNLMKIHPDVVSSGEIFNCYVILNQVLQYMSSKLYQQVNSQDKLPLVLQNEMTFNEIMHAAGPILKKKTWKDRTFSNDTVNKLILLVRDFLNTEESKKGKISRKRKSNKNKKSKKVKKNKSSDQPRREGSPCPSTASSSSTSSSSSSSSGSTSSSSSVDSDSSNTDKYDKLFKNNKHGKSSSPVIKQVFQTVKHNTRKKMVTPGERARFMIKIELTDCKDLKKCKSPKSYWTQVSKKSVFLLESKDEMLKKIDEIMLAVGQRISKTKGVEIEALKLDHKNEKYT